jgi:hypothetical protein
MPTIEQLTSFIVGLATFATAIATFLTVREMTRQRKAAYRPDVVAARQFAFAYSSEGTYDFAWTKDSPASANGGVRPCVGRQYALTLFNVGIGAAKQIEAIWSFDLESWIKALNDLAQRSFTPILIVNDRVDGTVRISGPGYPTHIQMVANQLKQEWGHLLPASIDRLGVDGIVPACFLSLAALQISMSSKLAGEGGIEVNQWPTIPTAKLSLKYFDVGAELHEKVLQLSLSLLSVSRTADCQSGDVFAYHIQASVQLEEVSS